jgi:hypothetical protein
MGLCLGVELVTTPRQARLRWALASASGCWLGVIVSRRGREQRPQGQLCISRRSADVVVAALDRTLSEGW